MVGSFGISWGYSLGQMNYICTEMGERSTYGGGPSMVLQQRWARSDKDIFGSPGRRVADTIALA